MPSHTPRLSVILTTYDRARYDDFTECVDSVLSQSYDDYEVIIVTETDGVDDAVRRDYGDHPKIVHHHLSDGKNLAAARNAGAARATGEAVVFTYDDCVADADWLAELARGFRVSNAPIVGGRADPEWVGTEDRTLPPEFYWLVGATHRGFADKEGPVRNTFGCNIAFNRGVFEQFNGFNENFGKDHGHNLQGEETELCARIRADGMGEAYYVPSARVLHKVYPEQTTRTWLLSRAFWQGYTKAVMESVVEDSTDEEWGFLRSLFSDAVPQTVRQGVQGKWVAWLRVVYLFVFTGAVGVGFVAGHLADR